MLQEHVKTQFSSVWVFVTFTFFLHVVLILIRLSKEFLLCCRSHSITPLKVPQCSKLSPFVDNLWFSEVPASCISLVFVWFWVSFIGTVIYFFLGHLTFLVMNFKHVHGLISLQSFLNLKAQTKLLYSPLTFITALTFLTMSRNEMSLSSESCVFIKKALCWFFLTSNKSSRSVKKKKWGWKE